jgi:protein phosphatase 1 regulatory subunit 7
MSRPLEPKGDFTLPAGLTDAAPEPTARGASGPPPAVSTDDDEAESPPPSDGESNEPFANLKLDERHFEDSKRKDERRAQLVMGPPLGGNSSNPNNETVIEGEVLAENEDILADLPDDATDLELTHLRLRTLRGLGLQRFTKVQVSALLQADGPFLRVDGSHGRKEVSTRRAEATDTRRWELTPRPQRVSLRQNLLSSLSFVPLPTTPPQSQSHTLSDPATTTVATASTADEPDEDELDDEDAKKKEDEFPYHEHRRTEGGEMVWPLKGLTELEELDLYDNSLKSVKGLEGLSAITCVLSYSCVAWEVNGKLTSSRVQIS